MLSQTFYRRSAEQVAKDLLGKVLVHKSGNKIISGIIVETEAYVGPHDLACHASKGKTARTKIMFDDAGHWYVYMIYGMYFNLNIITEKPDYPAAVLIRALEPLEGIESMEQNRKTNDIKKLTSGPGKLCQALGIDKYFYGKPAFNTDSELYIEDQGFKISAKDIVITKRIGIDYAGEWKDKLLRYYLKNNPYVSKK